MTDRIDRELILEASIDTVWHALTDDTWLSEWLADDVTLELHPGGEARFRFGESERSGWVEEILPPRPDGRSGRVGARLTFWWTQDDDAASRVELALSAQDDARTHLSVTETRPLDALELVGLRLPGLGGGTYGPALAAR